MALYVPANISIDFAFPKLGIAFGPDKVFTAFMFMPKTSIYKNNCPVFRKNNVWFSWKPDIVLSIPKTFREEIATHDHLWFRILPFYIGHISTSNLGRVYIGHMITLKSLFKLDKDFRKQEFCKEILYLMSNSSRINISSHFYVAFLTMVREVG